MTNAAYQRIDPPAPAERRHWYLGRNGKQQGPFAFAEIVSFAGDEAIDPNDLVWRPGLHNWVSVETISGLLSPPPLPPSSRAPARFDVPPPLPAESRKPAPPDRPVAEPVRPDAAPVQPSAAPIEARAPIKPAPSPEPGAEDSEAHAPSADDTIAANAIEAEATSEAAPLQALAGLLATLPNADASSGQAGAPVEEASDEGDLPEHEKERLRGLVSGILEPPEPQAAYFVRHWRGELSFSTSLFINGIMLTAAMGGAYALVTMFGSDILHALAARLPIFAAAVTRLTELREASPPLLRLGALALPWLAACGLYIWSLVGIFRSAINRL
ncbi:MAG TPA: GYF domain-containing protein [Stellaceae bacterium]|nr:GYF domain-containing protein [Stellaceae bacterium]